GWKGKGTGPRGLPGGTGGKEVKVVIVGDGGCGKTSLLMVYAKGAFPEQYAPSVFEKYTTSVTVGKKEVTLNLYDTAGQEDYDRLRPLSYQNTNVVLICYDVMNPTSYDNVAAKWYPEVNHFCRGVPLVLIGCKTDLRKDKEQLRKLRAAKQEPITYNQVNFSASELVASWQEIKHVVALLLTGVITGAEEIKHVVALLLAGVITKLGEPGKEMIGSTNRGFCKFFLEVVKSPPSLVPKKREI
uniref:Ras homolog family member F, filopodia associated n=1 Tax=Ficedula albicollis TaxID=59894 RepID=A0A803V2P2_FICAL